MTKGRAIPSGIIESRRNQKTIVAAFSVRPRSRTAMVMSAVMIAPVRATNVPTPCAPPKPPAKLESGRSEEHTSELQSLMRISYAVFCLKKKNQVKKPHHQRHHNTDKTQKLS